MRATPRQLATSDVEALGPIPSVGCTDRDLIVTLTDGRTVTVPLWWYPRLLHHDGRSEARYRFPSPPTLH